MMKQVYIHMVWFLVAVVSCINEAAAPVGSESRIVFDAVIGNDLSVSGELGTYPENVPFKVWAYDGSGAVMDGEEVYYHNGRWNARSESYWASDALDFYAYSPADAPAEVSEDTGIVFEGFDIAENSDFLCATPVIGCRKPETDLPVYMIFESPLCEVEFQAYSSSEDRVRIWITGLELKEVAHAGDYRQVPSAKWTGLDNRKDVSVFQGRLELTEAVQKIAEPVLVIPQKVRPVLSYEYSLDGNDAVIELVEELNMDGMPGMMSGRRNIYTIKVTENVVSVQNPGKGE